MVDIIDTQNTIIKMQSDIIDKLFLLLMQYITVEEVDGLDIVKKIDEVARVSINKRKKKRKWKLVEKLLKGAAGM